MEELDFQNMSYSEEELAEQKKQKGRNRIFAVLLGLALLLTAVLITEIVLLIA